MSTPETIKDYLVSIGMKVNDKSFKNATSAVKKFKGLSLTNFAKIASGATALASAVAVAMAKFATSVAEADRQTGLLARRLYTTKENARALSTAMKAMNIGSIEQLREVAQDPEIRSQFLELKNLARSLENPKTQQAMKEIRQLNFEYQKLMVRFEYFKMEIASKILEIFKKLKPYIQKMIDWFKPVVVAVLELKNSIMEAMPQMVKWAKIIWKDYILPICNLVKSLIIFVVKGFTFVFKGIKDMPKSFESAFRVIKFVLDPIIKIFRFIEDMIVYLSGGLSYREKTFDKIPWMRKIREEATGYESENQKQERIKEARADAKYTSDLTARYGIVDDNGKQIGLSMGKETIKRRFNPYTKVHGFNALKVTKSGAVDPNGLLLSGSNLMYLTDLQKALGSVAGKFSITSGWEGGHAKNSQHHYGKAMDFGFAGTSLESQLALIRAVLNSAYTKRAFLEVDAQTKNMIFNQLKSEGYDVGGKNSKIQWINTARGNNHLHTENVGMVDAVAQAGYDANAKIINSTVNNTYNVVSTDPKVGADEISRKANEFYKGGLEP